MRPLSQAQVISSINHPELRPVVALRGRTARETAGRTYLEGMRFVGRAALANVVVTCLIDRTSAGHHAHALAAGLRRSGVRTLAVSNSVLDRLGFGADHQGIGAVIRATTAPMPIEQAESGQMWLAIRTLQSAGNFGTIVRTAEAAGIRGIFLVGQSIDPFEPRAVRASMGSIASVPFHRTALPDLVDWCHQSGAQLVGASPNGSVCLSSLDAEQPCVVYLGTERKGLLPDEAAACAQLVSIPMREGVDSLNVAVAAGLFMYRGSLSRPC